MRSHSIFQEQKLLVPLLYSKYKRKLDIKKLNASFASIIKKEGVTFNQLAFVRDSLKLNVTRSLEKNSDSLLLPVAQLLPAARKQGTRKKQRSERLRQGEGEKQKRHLLKSYGVNNKPAVSCEKLSLLARAAEMQKWEEKSFNVQITLSFSSFEIKDLNSAFNLFQTFLTGLTNRLSTYRWFPSDAISMQSFSTSYLKVFSPISKSRRAGVSLKMPSFIDASDARISSLVVKAAAREGSKSKGRRDRIALIGILRTIRDLSNPLRTTHVPLSTRLHTVIRSPHVFKKTREQFATTRLKKIVKLNFKSMAAFRLLLDSLVLLKLPAELKITIKHF